jgi:hypothetical protein
MKWPGARRATLSRWAQLAHHPQRVRPLESEADQFGTRAGDGFVDQVRMLGARDQLDVFLAAGVGHQGQLARNAFIHAPLPQLIHQEQLLAGTAADQGRNPNGAEPGVT